MPLKMFSIVLLTAVIAFGATASMVDGKADLKSAGPLAFGPDGVLFIGDSAAGALFAIETGDTTAAKTAPAVQVKGINEKVAAMLGTSADQILINDVKTNPVSKNIYLSVSRGRGPDATPVILRLDATGKITPVSLDKVMHSSLVLPNAKTGERVDTITDIAYVKGNVIVAGLSNEEFASNLRVVPFPFQAADKGAGIEIFHGSHGRYETASPVRTFIPYTINNQEYILASYTCTPLVKIPISELKPGSKVKGTTIAELGAGNRPLDMVAYHKDGHDYILMANSSRGVMKLQADHLEKYQGITMPTDITGVPYQSLSDLKGVKHLEKYDDSMALVLADAGGSVDLRSIPLP
jgi:hypothetical protein